MSNDVLSNKSQLKSDIIYSDIVSHPPIMIRDSNRRKEIVKENGGRNVITQRVYMPPSYWYWLNCKAEDKGIAPGQIIQEMIDERKK